MGFYLSPNLMKTTKTAYWDRLLEWENYNYLSDSPPPLSLVPLTRYLKDKRKEIAQNPIH